MRTKKKISLTIDEKTYQDIEDASKTYGIPKSRIAQEAFVLWLKKVTEDLMAKGYDEMNKECNSIVEQTFDT